MRGIRISTFKKIDRWIIVSLVLAAILIVSGVSRSGILGAKESGIMITETRQLYKDFVCSCCGQNIGECTCGEAEEKRKVVDDLVGKRLGKTQIYKEMVKKYGEEILFDKLLAAEIKKGLVAEAPADRPIISLTPESYDFADVSQKKGKVFTFFNLKNEGKSDLVIDRLETSCECTFASIVFRGEESPLFAMPGHGYENPNNCEVVIPGLLGEISLLSPECYENPDNWKVIIPPGEQAKLKVYYDPNVHRDFRGPAIREVSVFSNDPVDFQKKVRIELNQVN